MCRYRLAFAVVKYFRFGGMQRNLLRIAAACAARGHDVRVFASEWAGPVPDDIDVTVLDVRAMTNHGRNEQFGRALRAATEGAGFDCIVGSNRTSGLDVYYAGDPCFAARFEASKPMVYRLLPRYRHFLSQEAEVFAPDQDTEILLPAHVEQPKFIRHYQTPRGRFHLLPPGIDRARLLDGQRDGDVRDELGIAARELVLLSVGSGFKTKGVDRTVRALAALPDGDRRRCRLVVVGDGDPRGCRRLARRLGVADRVIFTGPRDDLRRLYDAADVLVHPARVENTGNALIEAMVCGVPVLATASCGYAGHVERAEAGELCPVPFAQPDLDRRLAAMVADEAARRRWSRNALAYCAATDLYGMVERAADAIIERARRNRAAAAPGANGEALELRRARA